MHRELRVFPSPSLGIAFDAFKQFIGRSNPAGYQIFSGSGLLSDLARHPLPPVFVFGFRCDAPPLAGGYRGVRF